MCMYVYMYIYIYACVCVIIIIISFIMVKLVGTLPDAGYSLQGGAVGGGRSGWGEYYRVKPPIR